MYFNCSIRFYKCLISFWVDLTVSTQQHTIHKQWIILLWRKRKKKTRMAQFSLKILGHFRFWIARRFWYIFITTLLRFYFNVPLIHASFTLKCPWANVDSNRSQLFSRNGTVEFRINDSHFRYVVCHCCVVWK